MVDRIYPLRTNDPMAAIKVNIPTIISRTANSVTPIGLYRATGAGGYVVTGPGTGVFGVAMIIKKEDVEYNNLPSKMIRGT